MRPSVTHEPFSPSVTPEHLLGEFSRASVTPNQLRWRPLPKPSADQPTDFVHGLYSMCGAGSAADKSGYAVHMYACNQSMEDSCLCNADGELLVVPQEGALRVKSEFGLLHVPPGSVMVMPRGVRFAVELESETARGYVLEVYSGRFELPNLGPIGANGLAAERDFEAPVAWYEETEECHSAPGQSFRVVHKFEGMLFEARQPFSTAHMRTMRKAILLGIRKSTPPRKNLDSPMSPTFVQQVFDVCGGFWECSVHGSGHYWGRCFPLILPTIKSNNIT